jgi:hypothetical protein
MLHESEVVPMLVEAGGEQLLLARTPSRCPYTETCCTCNCYCDVWRLESATTFALLLITLLVVV